MRQLTEHKVDEQALDIRIHVVTEAHGYMITSPDEAIQLGDVIFQTGPVREVGYNGVSTEALLAICKDRLEHFQAGAYACKSNGAAIEHIGNALMALKSRTLERLDRGVEGTYGL